jgi:hypothetical protein
MPGPEGGRILSLPTKALQEFSLASNATYGATALQPRVGGPSLVGPPHPIDGQVIDVTGRRGKKPERVRPSEDGQVIDLTERRRQKLERLRPPEDAGLTEWSNYFDQNWMREGLSQDWHNLRSLNTNKRIGFVMSRELASLGGPGDVNRQTKWFPKAERNLAGFKLEFLSDHIVYPRQYSRSVYDRTRLVDQFYSDGSEEDDKKSDIEALVSSEERNGSVKRSVGEIKSFLLDAPVGSMTVMVSPLGETGFKSNDGLGEDYPDSYIFIGYKNGEDRVLNYTIKTNFTLSECRAFIEKVAGKKLHPGASMEEYVEAIAKIKKGQSEEIDTVFDVVTIMQGIHPDEPFVDEQTGKKTTWEDVVEDIRHGEELYDFEKRANGILKKFKEYGKGALHDTREAIQKATAAAILLLSDDFYNQKDQEALTQRGIPMEPAVDVTPGVIELRTFGQSLDLASERPGCTGSNSTSTRTTLGGELLTTQGNKENCPDCGKDLKNGHYHCTKCKEYYPDETYIDKDHRTPECRECKMKFNC